MDITSEPVKRTLRATRVPDDIWARALAESKDRGETMTAVVIRLLTWYGDGNDPTRKPADAPFSPARDWILMHKSALPKSETSE